MVCKKANGLGRPLLLYISSGHDETADSSQYPTVDMGGGKMQLLGILNLKHIDFR